MLGSATPDVDVVRARDARRHTRCSTLPERIRPVAGAPTADASDGIAGDAADRRGRPARGAARREPRHVQRELDAAIDDGAARGRAGDPVPQPSRAGRTRAVPRLRLRAGVRSLRRRADVPQAVRPAGLPPVQPAVAAAGSMQAVRSAARAAARAPASRRWRRRRRARSRTRGCCAGTATSRAAKGAHERILAAFLAHEADILIGTQMLAKGLDMPAVTWSAS